MIPELGICTVYGGLSRLIWSRNLQNNFFLQTGTKEKNTTIFYSTHILSEVSKICDRVGIIKDGKLLKVEEIENLKNKNLTKVTIISNDIDEIIKDLKIDKELQESKKITFNSEIEINILLEKLSKYNITKLLIEEPTLEDLFLHYYE